MYQCDFANPNPGENETQLDKIGEKRFMQKATQHTKNIYQKLLNVVVQRKGPVIELFEMPKHREKRLVIAYRQHTAQGLFSALSDLVYDF